MLSLDDLQVFDAVARTGGLSPAARAMGRSPAAVTRSLDRLEGELAARLFHRSTRVLRLTDEGRRLRGRLPGLFAEVEATRAAVRPDAALRGTLRLTAPTAFGTLVLPGVLRTLGEAHPALEVELVLSDRNLDLAQESLDLAVRVGDLGDSRLLATRLGPERRFVVASPTYLAAAGTPARPEELAGHRCIGLGGARAWPFRVGRRRRLVPVPTVVRADLAGLGLEAALAGVGVARLSWWQVREALEAGALVRLLREHEVGAEGAIAVLHPSRARASPRVKAFVGTLGKAVKAMAPPR
ncbi:MAG: LysR family transcriptional regulator [Myxococcota bacterium]